MESGGDTLLSDVFELYYFSYYSPGDSNEERSGFFGSTSIFKDIAG
jgi:hypothetical protein